MRKLFHTLTALALAALLSGCGGASREAAPAAALGASAPAEAESTPEAAAEPEPSPVPTMPPAPDFDLAASRYAPDTPVLTVDGLDVDWETFFNAFRERAQYFYLYYGINDYSMAMDEDETVGDWIAEQAEIDVRSMALFENWAAELGIALTREDEEAVDREIQEYADTYYGGDLAAMFGDLSASQSYTRRKGLYARLNDKVFSHYFGEQGADLGDEDCLNYVRDQGTLYGKRILLKTLTDAGDPLDEETRAERLATAEELLEILRACPPEELPGTFDRLMWEYSEDPNLESYPDGFYFAPGEIDAMSDTLETLEEGELSGVTECDYGYQIIYRPPMDPDHVYESDQSRTYSLRYYVAAMLFGAMADERYEAQRVTRAEEFAAPDPQAWFEREN